jgi:pyridoxine 5'-phosphate synthase PdxJ
MMSGTHDPQLLGAYVLGTLNAEEVAAVEAHLGGADGITVHLREDRRHIQDEDVRRLRELTHIKLNLEMAATEEMLAIACRLKPEMAMLVPEGRHEVLLEGSDLSSGVYLYRLIVDNFATTKKFILVK